MPKHIVFDVVGTLVAYTHLTETLTTLLGPKLLAQNITPTHLVATWFEVAEREYAYLSIANAYRPFDTCVESLFYRTLYIAGIKDPKGFATPGDLEALLDAYRNLSPRDGARECVELLRKEGFEVWGLTAGGWDSVKGYLEKGEVGIREDRLLSCDEAGVGKPDLRAYAPLWERLRRDGDAEVWFAAAHAWDVSAARKIGFKAAYCTTLEGEPIPELFGEMDVIGESLVTMAERVIAKSRVDGH